MVSNQAVGRRLLLVMMFGSWLLPGWTPQSATVHPAQESEAWGEPVDGVQLKLAVSKNRPPRFPGGLPPFETQIRNQGSGPVTFVAEAIVLPTIEIDGVWYSQAWAGSCCSNPTEIGPGARSDALPIYIVETHLFELNARPARTPTLRPGKHSIRVRSNSSDHFYVHRVARLPLVLLSNTITIEIPPARR
jgi:hypothetical protein